MAQILALRNRHFFETLQKFMLDKHVKMCLDITGVIWHYEDVQAILAQDTYSLVSK